MTTAKHRAIDRRRRGKRIERKHEEIGHTLEDSVTVEDIEAKLDDHVGDDLLRLVLTSCHPVLSTEARVALTGRVLGGLPIDEIARAFLVPEPTIAQRIVRAKRTLAEAKVPFEVPRGEELAARTASVLEVLYLIFNEGYSPTAGDDWMRPALCEDALEHRARIGAEQRTARGGHPRGAPAQGRDRLPRGALRARDRGAALKLEACVRRVMAGGWRTAPRIWLDTWFRWPPTTGSGRCRSRAGCGSACSATSRSSPRRSWRSCAS